MFSQVVKCFQWKSQNFKFVLHIIVTLHFVKADTTETWRSCPLLFVATWCGRWQMTSFSKARIRNCYLGSRKLTCNEVNVLFCLAFWDFLFLLPNYASNVKHARDPLNLFWALVSCYLMSNLNHNFFLVQHPSCNTTQL